MLNAQAHADARHLALLILCLIASATITFSCLFLEEWHLVLIFCAYLLTLFYSYALARELRYLYHIYAPYKDNP